MHKKKKIRKCKRGQKFCKNSKCAKMIPIHSFICSYCNFINEKKKKKESQKHIKNVMSYEDQLEKGASLNKKNLQALKAHYLNQIFEVSIFIKRDQVLRQEFLTDKGSFYTCDQQNQNILKDFQFENSSQSLPKNDLKNSKISFQFGKSKQDVQSYQFLVGDQKTNIGFTYLENVPTCIQSIIVNDYVFVFSLLSEEPKNTNRFEVQNRLTQQIQENQKLCISLFQYQQFDFQTIAIIDCQEPIFNFEVQNEPEIQKENLIFNLHILLKNGNFQTSSIKIHLNKKIDNLKLEKIQDFCIKNNYITCFSVKKLKKQTFIFLGTIAGEVFQYCKCNNDSEYQLTRVYNQSQNFCVKEIQVKIFGELQKQNLYFAICTQDGFIKIFQQGEMQPRFFYKISNKPIGNLYWDNNPSIIFFNDEQEENCIGAFSFNINQNQEGEQTETFRKNIKLQKKPINMIFHLKGDSILLSDNENVYFAEISELRESVFKYKNKVLKSYHILNIQEKNKILKIKEIDGLNFLDQVKKKKNKNDSEKQNELSLNIDQSTISCLQLQKIENKKICFIGLNNGLFIIKQIQLIL